MSWLGVLNALCPNLHASRVADIVVLYVVISAGVRDGGRADLIDANSTLAFEIEEWE